jgi:F-type H+-transporting ATPase subunit epsilon
MSEPLEVHVVTPERELWSGEASIVIARGVAGEVGILAGHAPLMIRLAIGPLRIQREGASELAAVVDGGFMHVTSAGDVTRVDVLAANAEMVDEIDVDAARRRATELEDQLRERDTGASEADIEGVQEALHKAQARINLAG